MIRAVLTSIAIFGIDATGRVGPDILRKVGKLASKTHRYDILAISNTIRSTEDTAKVNFHYLKPTSFSSVKNHNSDVPRNLNRLIYSANFDLPSLVIATRLQNAGKLDKFIHLLSV